MIKICSVSTATPPLRLTQKEALQFIRENFKVQPGTLKLYERVFGNESVETRYFSLENIEAVLEEDPDKINRRFEKQAIQLSALSLKKALFRAKIEAQELDFLAVSTCTGYVCPGLAAQLIEPCGLRHDLRYVEVVGMGCGSAIPAMEQCHNFLKANPNGTAASISTEICSAAMYSDDAPELVISNAIFADGSAATILTDKENRGQSLKGQSPIFLKNFASLTYPKWKEELRFTTQNGRLRNKLGVQVPTQAAQSVKEVVALLCKKSGIQRDAIQYWIAHTGGKRVLDEIQKSLSLPDLALAPSRKILKNYGNLSSPSVLYVLEEVLTSSSPKKGELSILVSFGAGFSAHACLLEF